MVLDPYEDGKVPGCGPLRLEADAVLCSHSHRDHGYAQTSEFPFPDLYLHESVADLAETDPAFPAFLEECLENFTCHEYGHLSSMDQVENFLSRDLRKENTWMQGNYPSENWGEVHLEIFYDQGLFHRLEKAPRDLALAQQKKEREAAQ